MEDVFAAEGAPPPGWTHAIFDGGPYHDDVGRCVPGPPAPKTLPTNDGARSTTYYLLSVGSWSDPSDPIGLYVAGRASFMWSRLRRAPMAPGWRTD